MTTVKTHRRQVAVWAITLALVAAGIVLALQASAALAVTVNPQPVSIMVSRETEEPVPPFTAKFEPSGTHVKDGLLKVRIDIFPSVGSKCYDQYYVTLPRYTEEELKENPELKQEYYQQLNPCLCHFIIIDRDMSTAEVEAYVSDVFNKELIHALDDIMSRGADLYEVSSLMRGKNVAVDDLQAAKLTAEEQDAAKQDANTELQDMEVIVGDTTSTNP